MYVKSMGGLYHTFSGGISGVNEQATSTAPSWMAMLTGGWGGYNGITDNSQMKNPNAETFLTTVAKQGHNASFTTSWREHTELSYRPDIANSIKENISVEYTHQIDDTATYYQILKYVAKPAGEEKLPQKTLTAFSLHLNMPTMLAIQQAIKAMIIIFRLAKMTMLTATIL